MNLTYHACSCRTDVGLTGRGVLGAGKGGIGSRHRHVSSCLSELGAETWLAPIFPSHVLENPKLRAPYSKVYIEAGQRGASCSLNKQIVY